MTTVAIDTQKTTQKLQDSGFSKKQAVGVAEVLAEALAEYPRKDAVISAIEESALGINRRIDATERRLGERIDSLKAEHGAKFTALEAGQAELKTGQAAHGVKLSALEAGQAELKAGQAVLMENQSELRREVKGNSVLLAAIMAHLGIPVPPK